MYNSSYELLFRWREGFFLPLHFQISVVLQILSVYKYPEGKPVTTMTTNTTNFSTNDASNKKDDEIEDLQLQIKEVRCLVYYTLLSPTGHKISNVNTLPPLPTLHLSQPQNLKPFMPHFPCPVKKYVVSHLLTDGRPQWLFPVRY